MVNATYLTLGLVGYVVLRIACVAIYNLYYHPLAKFPGPKYAAATEWHKTYQEVICQRSWVSWLEELHAQYGPVCRVGPNQLHFARPNAYNEIYNNSNRWNKEGTLYHSLSEGRSSFGYLTYAEAKERKDVLTPLFSHRAICNLQDLVQSNVNRFCDALKTNNAAGKSSDLFFGLRCFTLDTVISFCFARTVDAIGAPDFKAPIIEAMHAALPAALVFKHFRIVRKVVLSMPPWLSVGVSPQTAGLINIRQILHRQVDEAIKHPEGLQDTPHPTIYHQLLNKEANKNGVIPEAASLYEEAQALMFGGTDTTGNALMLGTFHMLENQGLLKRLKEELHIYWPNPDKTPRFEDLQKLRFLTAVIKESLRISPDVASPLLRIVPAAGATIDGASIPAGTIVGMSGVFVHNSEQIFKDALKFDPDRWLQPDSASLDNWLVAFSKGPRACIGQNLAWCELYLMFAALFRRFDMELDGTSLADLTWRDCFLPHFYGRHLEVFCQPVAD